MTRSLSPWTRDLGKGRFREKPPGGVLQSWVLILALTLTWSSCLQAAISPSTPGGWTRRCFHSCLWLFHFHGPGYEGKAPPEEGELSQASEDGSHVDGPARREAGSQCSSCPPCLYGTTSVLHPLNFPPFLEHRALCVLPAHPLVGVSG